MENKTLNIKLSELVEICTNNNYEIITKISNSMNNNMYRLLGVNKYQENFSDYVTIYNDGNLLLGNIRPCYEDFLLKLVYYLNLDVNPFEIKPAAIPLTLDDGLRLSLIYKKR